jgi:ribosomal protein S18 acetylase RimI-like enzyme
MNPEDFVITAASDEDVIKECARIMASNDPWKKLNMDIELCRQAFEGDHREVYILRFRGELAGFAILQVKGTFTGYIQSICIDEKFRNRGFGSNLMSFCEKRIHEFSPNIFICVSVFNEGARRLYESMGFKLVGELDNFLREGFTELLLRKTIGPRIGYKSN